MNNLKYSRINPFRDLTVKTKYKSIFITSKRKRKNNEEEEEKEVHIKKDNNKTLFDICLTKCSKLTDRIDFYSIPYHVGKKIILRAKESHEILSLETIQHLSYVYEDEISEFPYYLRQLRIWNRILSREQFLGLSNLSRVLTHLDLKLADLNNNSVAFLNCLINLKFLDLSLNPKLSDFGISKMLVPYYNYEEEKVEGDRMCFENLQMLNLSYNPLITDQFMFKYCEKFKSLIALEVSNTSISTVGISYFLKQQKNKWGLLASDYELFDEYNDILHLNPFEDYYNNSYDTYHKDKNYLNNPLPKMVSKPVTPVKINIEKLKFYHPESHELTPITDDPNHLTENGKVKEEGEKEEKDWGEEEEDLEEALLYNSVYRGEECSMEDRPSFNWHQNRNIIKQNTLNYIWKLFRKIPLNTGVVKFNSHNDIITVQLENNKNNNNNKRNINSVGGDQDDKVLLKKPKAVKRNTSDSLVNSVVMDIFH